MKYQRQYSRPHSSAKSVIAVMITLSSLLTTSAVIAKPHASLDFFCIVRGQSSPFRVKGQIQILQFAGSDKSTLILTGELADPSLKYKSDGGSDVAVYRPIHGGPYGRTFILKLLQGAQNQSTHSMTFNTHDFPLDPGRAAPNDQILIGVQQLNAGGAFNGLSTCQGAPVPL